MSGQPPHYENQNPYANPWGDAPGAPAPPQPQSHSSYEHAQQTGAPASHNDNNPFTAHPPSQPFASEAQPPYNPGSNPYSAPPPPHAQQDYPSSAHHASSDFSSSNADYNAPSEYNAPPGLPPRRTGTDIALPQGQDRSHQVEVMQSYEMSRNRPETEAEQDQAALEREFPKLDGSLIAAIYGDSGSLSATREMLQELSSGEQ